MSRKPKPTGTRRQAFRGSQQDLVRRLESLGITVELTAGGHYKAHCPKGVVVMSQTPSDRHAALNNVKILRRYGVHI